MEMETIWVVCPCFLDVPSFRRTREEVLQTLTIKFPQYSLKFILIDDSAGTDPELSSLHSLSDTQIISVPYHRGHQSALVFGLRKLGQTILEKDFVITMDADGEDIPSDTQSILDALLKKEAQLSAVALALRTHRQESPPFKIAYFFYKQIFFLLTGKIIKSGNFAGFRGLFLKETIHHSHFDQCYSSSFISLPLQIDYVPLARGKRFFGASKMNFGSLLNHGLRMLLPFSDKIIIRGIFIAGILTVALLLLFSNSLPMRH